MFQVGFSTQADSSEALVRATRYMLGLECVHDDHPIDTHPHCYGEDADPKDENRCVQSCVGCFQKSVREKIN